MGVNQVRGYLHMTTSLIRIHRITRIVCTRIVCTRIVYTRIVCTCDNLYMACE